MAEKVIVPEMDLSGIISESRDVAQALNKFANDLKQIDKKYAKLRIQKNEESLCDSCANKIGNRCFSLNPYGENKKHCDHYKPESEEGLCYSCVNKGCSTGIHFFMTKKEVMDYIRKYTIVS